MGIMCVLIVLLLIWSLFLFLTVMFHSLKEQNISSYGYYVCVHCNFIDMLNLSLPHFDALFIKITKISSYGYYVCVHCTFIDMFTLSLPYLDVLFIKITVSWSERKLVS